MASREMSILDSLEMIRPLEQAVSLEMGSSRFPNLFSNDEITSFRVESSEDIVIFLFRVIIKSKTISFFRRRHNSTITKALFIHKSRGGAGVILNPAPYKSSTVNATLYDRVKSNVGATLSLDELGLLYNIHIGNEAPKPRVH